MDASTQPQPAKRRFMDAFNVPAFPPPLLRLPHPLQRRIHSLDGLAPLHWDGLPCLLNLHGDFETCRLGFYGLLLLFCRAIHAEASALTRHQLAAHPAKLTRIICWQLGSRLDRGNRSQNYR